MAENQKFNFPTPLHLACATDELRPVMEYVHFVNGFAYASDAHILVKQSINEYCTVHDKENLTGKCIHRDSFENIRKFDNAKALMDGIECWDDNGGKKAFFPYGTVEEKRPNFETVIPDGPAENVPFIGINPKYIEIASKCLARDKHTAVRMIFHGQNKAIILKAEDYPEQIVIIMPIILGGNLF